MSAGDRALVLVAILSASASARGDDVVRNVAPSVKETPPASSPSPFDNALRLARMIHDDRTVAQLLQRRASTNDISDAEIAEVVSALESIGEPEEAVRFLELRVRRFPRSATFSLLELARLHERRGDTSASVAAYKRLVAAAGPVGLSVPEYVEYARALSVSGDDQAALALLLSVEGLARFEDEGYWVDLATLAWELDASDVALRALRVVWGRGYAMPGAASHLMTLEAEHGVPENAIAVGLADFQQTQDPTALLFAANLQTTRGDWRGAQATLAIAARALPLFATREEYWVLRGEVAQRLGDAKGALEAFRAALALDPASPVARSAVLWDAIDRSDARTMKRLLEEWGVTSEPELIDGYAVALHRLGRSHEALAYFTRVVKEGSITPGALYELSEVLAEVGYAEMALRARRAAMKRAEPIVRAALVAKTPTPDELESLKLGVELRARTGSTDIAEQWLRRYLRSPASQQEKDALELEMSLGSGQEVRAEEVAQRKTIDPDTRLRVALEIGDAWRARGLIGAADARERLDVAELLEDEGLLVSALRENLDNDPRDEDTSAWRRKLGALRVLHAPAVMVGGTFLHLGGACGTEKNCGALELGGFDASLAHDAFKQRVTWLVKPRWMAGDRDALAKTRLYAEVDATATMRVAGPRAFSDLGAGVVGHTLGTVPRAILAHERLFWHDRLAIGAEAAVGEEIDDTPFLRVAAVKDTAKVTGRIEVSYFYANAEVELREDQTRRFDHLGAQIGAVGEAGVRILREHPEWTIGGEATVMGRDNVTVLPQSVRNIPAAGATVGDVMPSSYQALFAITRLTKDTLAERERVDVEGFPRYECEAGIGAVFPFPTLAALAQCAASIRLGRGWLSALARYDLSGAGIRDANTFQFGLSYTNPF